MRIKYRCTDIQAKPEKIFQWFLELAENYCDWHPDHIKAEWVKGNHFEVGSVLYSEEYLHGEIHKMKFRTIEMIPNRLLRYKMLFPGNLISTTGKLIFEPKGSGTLFTATLDFRFGRLLTRFARKQKEELIKHMKEEGEILKKIMEKNQ
ncbi:MAG: SRPBCC family protein [Asgard group archaeon]|nr:SRPBCC family protein [Asgard group archaeon]